MKSKWVPLALAAVLLHVCALPLRAASQVASTTEDTGAVKAAIAKLGTGTQATVTIEMRDGSNARGYIWGAAAESFTLVEEKTRYATTIAYSDVIKLERGRPEWVKLLIFVGAGIGILTAVMAVAIVAAGGP
jgi:hypothetical protein